MRGARSDAYQVAFVGSDRPVFPHGDAGTSSKAKSCICSQIAARDCSFAASNQSFGGIPAWGCPALFDPRIRERFAAGDLGDHWCAGLAGSPELPTMAEAGVLAFQFAV
jgi:hypothetical protein